MKALPASGSLAFAGTPAENWLMFCTGAGRGPTRSTLVSAKKVKATWEEVGTLTDQQMIDMMVDIFRRHRGDKSCTCKGANGPSLDVVERLEARIGVPVVQAVVARCWEIQLRFDVARPLAGYGKLLSEMPQG